MVCSSAARPASESPRESTGAGQPQLPLLHRSGPLANWFRPARLEEVEGLLPDYLERNGLLSNRASVSSCEITHVAPIRLGETEVWFLIVEVEPRDGSSQTISLGLTFVPEGELEQLLEPLHLAGFAHFGLRARCDLRRARSSRVLPGLTQGNSGGPIAAGRER